MEFLWIEREFPWGAAVGGVWRSCGALRALGAAALLASSACSPNQARAPATAPAPANTKNANVKNIAAAERAIAAGRLGEGIEALDAILLKNPNETRALELKGVACLSLHRHGDARDIFAHIIKLHPNNNSARIGLSQSHEKLGDLDAAAAALDDVLRREPDHIVALFLSGQLAAKRQDDSKGKRQLTRALELEPWGDLSVAAHYSLSQIALRAGDAERAQEERALYQKQFKWADARAALERRLAAAPNDAAALRALGNLYIEARNAKLAIPPLEAAAKSAKDPRVWIELAGAHELAKDYKSALAAAGRALDLNRFFPAAYRYRARIYLLQNDLGRAVSSLREAVALDPAASADPAIREVTHQLLDAARAGGDGAAAAHAESILKQIGG